MIHIHCLTIERRSLDEKAAKDSECETHPPSHKELWKSDWWSSAQEKELTVLRVFVIERETCEIGQKRHLEANSHRVEWYQMRNEQGSVSSAEKHGH